MMQAKVWLCDQHPRKRFRIGLALDEAGHEVVEFSDTAIGAFAVLQLLSPGDIDVVLVGDLQAPERAADPRAELARLVRNRCLATTIFGVAYGCRPFHPDIRNFPVLDDRDAGDLAARITGIVEAGQ